MEDLTWLVYKWTRLICQLEHGELISSPENKIDIIDLRINHPAQLQ